MEIGLYSASKVGKNNISVFGGLDRTRKGSRFEFSDMHNISSHEYPCIAPEGGRVSVSTANNIINTVVAPDVTNTDAVTGITGVYDEGFYYNGVLKSGNKKLSSRLWWQIEQKGNMYIINGYDKNNLSSEMFYYAVDADEFGDGGKVMRNLIVTTTGSSMSTPYDSGSGSYEYTITTPDGTVICNKDFYTEYKKYTKTDGYGDLTLVSTQNIFELFFNVGDEVMVEGFPGSDNNGQIWSIEYDEITPQSLINASRNNTIDTDNMASTDNLEDTDICRMVVTGFAIDQISKSRSSHEIQFNCYNKNGEIVYMRNLKSDLYYCSGITLRKRARVFDNIAVHHGRIWGSTPTGNQIYASPSDDIFSFTSDDIVNGYGVRIASDSPGTFTALCSYNNDLVAFKRDSITIISGTNPINYNAVVMNGIGCISPRSVAVTPNGIIFLSYRGFYIYNGSVPQCISTKLNTLYTSAVSGFDGNIYYASAKRINGETELLMFDMRYGLWYKADDISANGFFRFCNEFYVCDNTTLYKLNGATPNDWSFTFNRVYENSLDNKGINEIWIRADISDGACFTVETASGNSGFKTHSKFSKPGLNTYRCPVKLKMADDYQIRIRGIGKVVFYEFEIKRPEGGRRYKEY